MLIVSVSNPKGGSGKTTTSINLSAVGAKKKQRVLLIDADPNRSATTNLRVERILSDRNMEDNNATKMFQDDPVPASQLAISLPAVGFDIVPASYDMADREQWLANLDDGGMGYLYDLLLEDKALEEKYDLVIIDTGGRTGKMLFTMLFASDWVIVPTPFSEMSIDQVRQVFPYIQNDVNKRKARYGFAGRNETIIKCVVPCRVKDNTIATREVAKRLVHALPSPSFLSETSISESTAVEDAVNNGLPIVVHYPQHTVAKQYVELFEEIFGA